jgi:hypothetical protein
MFLHQLSDEQGFMAMVCFVRQYAARGAEDDLITLLGDIEPMSDGGTFDPAAWDDWMECVRSVTNSAVGGRLIPSQMNEREAFKATSIFLNQFGNRVGDHLRALLTYIDVASSDCMTDSPAWREWTTCVRSARDDATHGRPS